MAATQTTTTSGPIAQVAWDRLRLDPMNPRVLEDLGEDATQDVILTLLWQDFAVDEIALSIHANGYFQHEPLFVDEEDGELVVIEGNRRLAAVRLLLDAEARRSVGATDLPRLSASRRTELTKLPILRARRSDVWQYLGFKHVNGPQAWGSYSKAQYIGWVRNKVGISLDEIARRIGDKHSTVRRLYRALMVIEQAEREDVFNRKDRFRGHFSFSHLYTGLDYGGIGTYLGLSDGGSYDQRNPIPKRKVPQLGELCLWLFGSKSRGLEPVVQSQNPDLRVLDEVLRSSDGVAALRQGLPLRVSRDISKGDDVILRDALIVARAKLQEARGKVLTGYHGEDDLFEHARDIMDLADRLFQEMTEIAGRAKAKSHRRR